MKRYGNIYYKIVDINNIKMAIFKASKRKRKRKAVQKILSNVDYYAKEIQDILQNKSYIPSPYIEKKIYDGSRKKERIIYKPKFYPDQVIHWCLMLQLKPILMKRMYYYSCGSIDGKGGKLARKGVLKGIRNNKYCLKLDIKKFYPSVNTNILKDKFKRLIKDKDTLWLIDTIIDSHDKGLPIGNYTSQWFANYYLTDLDFRIKNFKIKNYVRYMDDMTLFSNNKRKLRKVKIEIDNIVAKEHLSLKDDWQLINIDKRLIDFLGYRFYQDGTTIRRCNFLRIRRRIKRVSKQKLSCKNAGAVISYDGLLCQSNCFTFKTKYLYPYVSLKKCKEKISENTKYN